jgi:hypothetical protein
MDTASLRHLVATVAYRASKVLRDVPAGFATMHVSGRGRSPVQIVAHLGDLAAWALTLARDENIWTAAGSDDWDVEVQRFFDGLAALDAQLAAQSPSPAAAERLIQGPLADALTHVGQLAMLRGAYGAPVRPESYAKAEIVIGRVGVTQAAARREFDGDASRRT